MTCSDELRRDVSTKVVSTRALLTYRDNGENCNGRYVGEQIEKDVSRDLGLRFAKLLL